MSLSTHVYKMPCDGLASHPRGVGGGRVAILSVSTKTGVGSDRGVGVLWLVCDFTYCA